MTDNNRKLERNPMNKVIGGVCSGLGDYFNLDVALVRVLFVIALLFASFGFWLYIILWIVIPERKIDFNIENHQAEDSRQTQENNIQEDKDSKKTSAMLSGIIIVIVGLVLLVNNFISISWIWKLWPLILVAIGVIMIVKTNTKNNSNE